MWLSTECLYTSDYQDLIQILWPGPLQLTLKSVGELGAHYPPKSGSWGLKVGAQKGKPLLKMRVLVSGHLICQSSPVCDGSLHCSAAQGNVAGQSHPCLLHALRAKWEVTIEGQEVCLFCFVWRLSQCSYY